MLIGRFLCVYVPAFTAVAVLRVTIDRAIPLVIVITAVMALVLIGFAGRRQGRVRNFGFRGANLAIIGWTCAISLPLAIGAAALLDHFPEPGPLAGLHLQTWLAVLYFGTAAPIQEEVIFRGLLQTSLSNDLATKNFSVPVRDAAAVALVAVLFAVIHLRVGPLTAFFALVLGLLAGELRRRSGSLIPAILAHSIFNSAALYWGDW